jgi:hypothetical protein
MGNDVNRQVYWPHGAPVETMRFTTKPAGSGLNAGGSVVITKLGRTLRLGSYFSIPTAKPACRRCSVASGTGCEPTSGTAELVTVGVVGLLLVTVGVVGPLLVTVGVVGPLLVTVGVVGPLLVAGGPEGEPLLDAEPENAEVTPPQEVRTATSAIVSSGRCIVRDRCLVMALPHFLPLLGPKVERIRRSDVPVA